MARYALQYSEFARAAVALQFATQCALYRRPLALIVPGGTASFAFQLIFRDGCRESFLLALILCGLLRTGYAIVPRQPLDSCCHAVEPRTMIHAALYRMDIFMQYDAWPIPRLMDTINEW